MWSEPIPSWNLCSPARSRAWSHCPARLDAPDSVTLLPRSCLGTPSQSCVCWNISATCPRFCPTSPEGAYLSLWIPSFMLPQACEPRPLGLAFLRQGQMTQAHPCPPGGPGFTEKHVTGTAHSRGDFLSCITSFSGPRCEGTACSLMAISTHKLPSWSPESAPRYGEHLL